MNNIPIFIPHLGCKNDCAFCNQRRITGTVREVSINEARKIIESHLSTIKGNQTMIAFFGGSFTGIGEDRMRVYLSLAKEYLDRGDVCGIRLSTRPDYIDRDICAILREYGVTNVELGAQSLDDEVLTASRRGHDAAAVEKASKMLLDQGFTLGLQMMTGLPCDTAEKSLETARKIIAIGASETRIYPTLVLRGTHLEKMYTRGEYMPQSLEDAVDLAAKLYALFKKNGVAVLRVGLMNSKSLEDSLVAGPYSPNFGERVLSRMIRNEIEENALSGQKNITVCVSPRRISQLYGAGRENLGFFESRGIKLTVIQDEKYDFEIITEL